MSGQLIPLNKQEQKTFQDRRLQLIKSLPSGLAILESGGHKVRSNDTDYPYRASSNFYYLTGLSNPNCVLVLDTRSQTSCLYLAKRVPERELWTGEMLGPERVQEYLGIEESYPLEEIQNNLNEKIKNAQALALDLFQLEGPSIENKNLKLLLTLSQTRKANFSTPNHLVHLPPFIEKMRLIKSDIELTWMQKSNDIAKRAHHLAMATCKQGLGEWHLQAQCEWACRVLGPSSMAYESIVASGDRANTLHYIANNHPLKNGELVLIDAGCEWLNMASDITRTFPVNGKYTHEQKDVYQVVLQAQLDVINFISPGKTIKECHNKAIATLSQGLADLKIIKDSVPNIIEKESWKEFYPHGTSHWLGLDVHDQCPYKDEHLKDITFVPGMILTVEPALYFCASNLNVPERFKAIGIRIEDDIVVTQNGHLNLTKGLAKTVAEVEAACNIDAGEMMKEILRARLD